VRHRGEQGLVDHADHAGDPAHQDTPLGGRRGGDEGRAIGGIAESLAYNAGACAGPKTMTVATDRPPVEPVPACPVCGGEQRRPLLRDIAGIGVARCELCGLVHATGRYAAGYLSETYYGGRASQPPGQRDISRKRRSVQLYDRLSGGRIGAPAVGARALDIGCDTGLLLDALRELGYRTEGIERSPAAEHAKAAGHEVHALDIEVTELGLGRYELITMTHVLEHLREPVRALVWLRRHLAPGGIGVVEVPNWGDLLRPLWGRRFRPLELGDHVSFFERSTLAGTLERAGLDVLALWSAPQVGTSIAPSLLTALDLGLAFRRRLRDSGGESGAGVAAERAGVRGSRWQRAFAPRVVGGLDSLDRWAGPWLERLFGTHCGWGANLVAVVRAPAQSHANTS
jgi:2-polyprenyl-3-methyl-5-hydroxy-6-metoxy-1,4-benzoquinol methylase